MPFISLLYFRTAAVFLLLGIVMGLHMAATHDHSTLAAHAHVNLLGWVTPALFGAYFAFNPGQAERRLARLQYGVYVVGVVLMSPMLYLMLRGQAQLEPMVIVSSLLVLAGAILFAIIAFTGPVRMVAPRVAAE
ncbi:hypothetical protein [Fodinicurvata sediminis]|uniref:hypothetical protein n=1 Tax=Fodinicurvata sediminis TaxID=1121832 RepID=UPI0003B4C2F0|nr:hypothetical protein [Fodinicurvata sediminis]